jgi:hypothetical protein
LYCCCEKQKGDGGSRADSMTVEASLSVVAREEDSSSVEL